MNVSIKKHKVREKEMLVLEVVAMEGLPRNGPGSASVAEMEVLLNAIPLKYRLALTIMFFTGIRPK